MRTRIQRILSCLLLCALLSCLLPAPAAAAAAPSFRDVPSTHWAADSIQRAVKAGLIQGESASTFGVGRPMSRAAFLVVLCRFFGWEMQTPARGSFSDNQNPKAWYYSAVETAYSNGALTRQSSTCRPNDPVTREEMAVMLVRSLGYTTLAGLDQGLPCPFTDMDANRGYLNMAYYLGISGGTSATTFSPTATATREQAVVMLMRLYDRFHTAAPERIGLTTSAEGLTDLTGYRAVAITGAQLINAGSVQLVRSPAEDTVSAVQTAAKAAGTKVLLGVTANAAIVHTRAADLAEVLTAAVRSGGYDGVLLDIPRLPENQSGNLTFLVSTLKKQLGSGMLYVVADAPDSSGSTYGYQYAALAAAADRVILRVAAYDKTVSGFPTLPPEPLEEVYYALASLKGSLPAAKTSLWLTSTGLTRTGSSGRLSSVSAQGIEDLLHTSSATSRYSARYAVPYLIRTVNKSHATVWYHNADSAAMRVRMAALFGIGSVCLSDLTSVAEYSDYSLLAGLGAS